MILSRDYILTGTAAKAVDRYCIEQIGIPAAVYIERAAHGVFEEIDRDVSESHRRVCDTKVAVICGTGNNGADGIATARMLIEKGYLCKCYVIGDESRATDDFRLQKRIYENIGNRIISGKPDSYELEQECDYVVDAMFGVGLSRNVTGIYAEVIDMISSFCRPKVFSIDIASGLNADNGCVMGTCIKADVTVTFGKYRAGHLLGDGKDYSGKVVIKDIGFLKNAYEYAGVTQGERIYGCVTGLGDIPQRRKTSNKGTYGSVYIIGAGGNMSGAVALAGEAAYRCGAGLVKIYCGADNINTVKGLLRESVVHGFEKFDGSVRERDVIIIGPGLSTDGEAKEMLEKVLKIKCKKVIDADALNIMAGNKILLEELDEDVVITPHVKEMSRLTDKKVEEIRGNIVDTAREFSQKYGCNTVLKDCASVTVKWNGSYIEDVMVNTTGNSGMSKGGSGDVLAGVIAGLMTQNMSTYDAAAVGVYLHGLAGDRAAARRGEYSILATDIIKEIPEILRNARNEMEN